MHAIVHDPWSGFQCCRSQWSDHILVDRHPLFDHGPHAISSGSWMEKSESESGWTSFTRSQFVWALRSRDRSGFEASPQFSQILVRDFEKTALKRIRYGEAGDATAMQPKAPRVTKCGVESLKGRAVHALGVSAYQHKLA